MDELLEQYERASTWTAAKVSGAVDHLDASTPCDDWDVRALLNHMLDSQRYFVGAAQGEDVSPPALTPPELLSSDPVTDFAHARATTVEVFGQPGVITKTRPSLAIAFSDLLLHSWDLAQATAQNTDMPAGLAETAFEAIHGRFTDDQRKGLFKPEYDVPPSASAQNQLLAYTGRQPDRVTACTTIEAAPEAVFAVLADPAAHADIDGTGWVRGPLDGDRITAAGQVFRMAMYHQNHPDKDYKIANRVEVFDEPRAIAWQPGTESPETGELSFGGWIWRYDLEATSPSKATVTLTYDWSAVPPHVRKHIQFPPFEQDHLDNSLQHLSDLVA
jgi:uncharacterized protein (TIGR03086 family)